MRSILIAALLLAVGGVAQAQTETPPQCQAVLRASVFSVVTECAEQPAGTACYGGAPVQAELNTSADFATPGQLVSLAAIDTLMPAVPDIEQGRWGIVTLTPRLNLTADVLTAWAVGGATLEDTGTAAADVPAAEVQVTFPQGARLRAAPRADAEEIAPLYLGVTVLATGISEDGAWVRVQAEGERGWTTVDAFSATDLQDLATVGADEPDYGPFQSFTLATDPNANACALVPPGGLLVQTPPATEAARLRVNETVLTIAPKSTVFLTAVDGLRVDVLEGEVLLDLPLTVSAGQGVDVMAEEPLPMSYDSDRLARLPVADLPRPIFVALDFDVLVRPAVLGENPLADVTTEDDCVIAAVNGAVNLRELPSPGGRVRHVMQIGESAAPDARAEGTDGELWWRLATDVWVSGSAPSFGGQCGALPLVRAD